jgi:DNA polymerase (family 10)
MLRIPGLRPSRVRKLYAELGIASIEAPEVAARSDRLKSLKGYGPAFQAKVLQGIKMSRPPQGRHLHRAAAAITYAANEIARAHPHWHIPEWRSTRHTLTCVRFVAPQTLPWSTKP